MFTFINLCFRLIQVISHYYWNFCQMFQPYPNMDHHLWKSFFDNMFIVNNICLFVKKYLTIFDFVFLSLSSQLSLIMTSTVETVTFEKSFDSNDDSSIAWNNNVRNSEVQVFNFRIIQNIFLHYLNLKKKLYFTLLLQILLDGSKAKWYAG